MDKDSWIILSAFVVIILGLLIYMSATGTINIDWNSILNIKDYSNK
jgi:hypothetical protein